MTDGWPVSGGTPPSGLLSVRKFGAVGDGRTDDAPALVRAIASRAPLLFPPGRYRLARTVVVQTPDAQWFGAGGELVLGTAGTRLLEIRASGFRAWGMRFGGGGREVRGSLVLAGPEARALSFYGCRFGEVKGRHGAGRDRYTNNQYALQVSPTGVTGFTIAECRFEEISNENTSVPTVGAGFCGGVAFMAEHFDDPVAGEPSDGRVAGCHFEGIRTRLATGLTEPDQIELNDADAIRFYGHATTPSPAPIRISDCRFVDCGKRAIKFSHSVGGTVEGCSIEDRSLAYPMVVGIKLAPGMVVRGVTIITPSERPIRFAFQSDDLAQVEVSGVVIDRCERIFAHAPGPTGRLTDVTFSQIDARAVSVAGFTAGEAPAALARYRLRGVRITGSAPGVLGFVNPVRGDAGGADLDDVTITNAALKVQGSGCSLRRVTVEITEPWATPPAGRSPIEVGQQIGANLPGTFISDLRLRVAVATGSATQPLMQLYGDGLTIEDLLVEVAEGVAVDWPHVDVYGHRIAIDGLIYDGPGTVQVSTTGAATHSGGYDDVTLRGAVRRGIAPAKGPFLRFGAGRENLLTDVTDQRPGGWPAVELSGGRRYRLGSVQSRSGPPTRVAPGATLAPR